MEVGRQITLWFIACCCASIIYTKELEDNASTTPPSEESSNLAKLETGNLNGTIMAHKNGTKVKLTLTGNVFWKNDKSIDSVTCAVPAVNVKGEKGDRGFNGISGLQGPKGEMGNKGDRGPNGNQGPEGKKGNQGDKGNTGAIGEKGEKGSNGTAGPKGEMGKCKLADENLNERKVKVYGDENNPAYSCSKVTEGKIFVNKPNMFQVECKNYMACVQKLPKQFDLTGLSITEVFGLLSKIELNKFYQLSIPKILYLLSTNNSFKLTLTYSKEVEILEILSWNGIKNEISKLMLNKLTGKQQGCNALKKTNTAGKTDLEISCTPAYYLPMDFYIKANKEIISIEIKELCFN